MGGLTEGRPGGGHQPLSAERRCQHKGANPRGKSEPDGGKIGDTLPHPHGMAQRREGEPECCEEGSMGKRAGARFQSLSCPRKRSVRKGHTDVVCWC